jgi:hypothetical protein
VHDGEPHWLVYAGDEAVDVYPHVDVPIGELATHADLSQRLTPTQIRAARAHRRAARALANGRRRVRRRQAPGPASPTELDRAP